MNNNSLENKNYIDQVVYLASLASEPRAIDPMLDKLRQISANLTDAQPVLSAKDKDALEELKLTIQNYLVTKEPLRHFTRESLEEKLYEHFQGRTAIRNLRWMLGAICLLAVVSGITISYIPLPINPMFHSMLGITAGYTVLYLGASWLFLSALKEFKSDYRSAYTRISIGISLLGLSQLQNPILGIFNLFDSTWVTMGGGNVPLILALSFVYFGIKKAAKSVGVTSRFIATWVIVATLAVGAIVLALIPHAPSPKSEWQFDASSIILFCVTTLTFFSSVITRLVKQRITPLYAKATKWLFHALWIMALGAGSVLAYSILPPLPEAVGAIVSTLTLLAFVVGGLLLLKAGYEFNKTTR